MPSTTGLPTVIYDRPLSWVVPGFRYIGWEEYGSLTNALAEKVRGSGAATDLVLGVARGGIPVAMVLADALGAPVDYITVRSYTGIRKRTPPRVLSSPLATVKGRRLLLVDDLVDEGHTMAAAKLRLQRMAPKSIETAVIFKKPWSEFEPDYYLEVTDAWVVFPFEAHEVSRELGSRHGRKAGRPE